MTPEPDAAVDERDPHVMLYTSGTTGDPEGRAALAPQLRPAGGADPGRRPASARTTSASACSRCSTWAAGRCRSATGRMAAPWSCMEQRRAGRDPAPRHARARHLPLPRSRRSTSRCSRCPSSTRTDLVLAACASAAARSVMTEAQVVEIMERFRNPNLFVHVRPDRGGAGRDAAPARRARASRRRSGRPALERRRPADRPDGADAGARRGRRDRLPERVHDAAATGACPEATARDAARRLGAHGRPGDASTTRASCTSPAASKEMIKTGGENVYPAEVERRLLEHPAIAEAAVLRRPGRPLG